MEHDQKYLWSLSRLYILVHHERSLRWTTGLSVFFKYYLHYEFNPIRLIPDNVNDGIASLRDSKSFSDLPLLARHVLATTADAEPYIHPPFLNMMENQNLQNIWGRLMYKQVDNRWVFRHRLSDQDSVTETGTAVNLPPAPLTLVLPYLNNPTGTAYLLGILKYIRVSLPNYPYLLGIFKYTSLSQNTHIHLASFNICLSQNTRCRFHTGQKEVDKARPQPESCGESKALRHLGGSVMQPPLCPRRQRNRISAAEGNYVSQCLAGGRRLSSSTRKTYQKIVLITFPKLHTRLKYSQYMKKKATE